MTHILGGGLSLLFYLIVLSMIAIIAVGYELLEFLWPAICDAWDIVVAVLYWPLDKLLTLLHVPRAGDRTPDEGEGDE